MERGAYGDSAVIVHAHGTLSHVLRSGQGTCPSLRCSAMRSAPERRRAQQGARVPTCTDRRARRYTPSRHR
eukprot:scaffold33561_cov28-Tisochrysis_lutea.AAC.4